MTDLTERLRRYKRDRSGYAEYCHQAADEIDRLRAEVAGLRAELELRRKSGSATDRLDNLCEGIADHADGSEWSREEWSRMDAENTALRSELGSLISQFHHAMKDAGWHPGRTDDNLCDIIRAKGKEMATMKESWGMLADASIEFCEHLMPTMCPQDKAMVNKLRETFGAARKAAP